MYSAFGIEEAPKSLGLQRDFYIKDILRIYHVIIMKLQAFIYGYIMY